MIQQQSKLSLWLLSFTFIHMNLCFVSASSTLWNVVCALDLFRVVIAHKTILRFLHTCNESVHLPRQAIHRNHCINHTNIEPLFNALSASFLWRSYGVRIAVYMVTLGTKCVRLSIVRTCFMSGRFDDSFNAHSHHNFSCPIWKSFKVVFKDNRHQSRHWYQCLWTSDSKCRNLSDW